MRIELITDWIRSTPPRVDYEHKVIQDMTTGNKYIIKIYMEVISKYGGEYWVLHFPPIESVKDIYKTFNNGSTHHIFATLQEAKDKADFVLKKYSKLKAFL